MFVQIFQKLFERRNFFYRLCLNSSLMQVCVFQKTQTDQSNQNKKTEAKTSVNKNEIFT
jgi:hypothetical protein